MFPTDLIGCLSVRYVFCKCFQTNGNLQLRILTVCFLLTLPAACIYGVLLRNTLRQLFLVTCAPIRYVFAYIPTRYIFRRCFQTNSCFRSHACQCGMFSLIYQFCIFSGNIPGRFRSHARRYGMFISGRFRFRANMVYFLRLFMPRMTTKNKGSVSNMGKNPCVTPLQTTACQK